MLQKSQQQYSSDTAFSECRYHARISSSSRRGKPTPTLFASAFCRLTQTTDNSHAYQYGRCHLVDAHRFSLDAKQAANLSVRCTRMQQAKAQDMATISRAREAYGQRRHRCLTSAPSTRNRLYQGLSDSRVEIFLLLAASYPMALQTVPLVQGGSVPMNLGRAPPRRHAA